MTKDKPKEREPNVLKKIWARTVIPIIDWLTIWWFLRHTIAQEKKKGGLFSPPRRKE